MLEENVDIVRRQLEAANRRDFAAVMNAYTEDVVLVVEPSVHPTNAGTFSGREAVGNWFGDWLRSFDEDYHFDIEEAVAVDERVFLVASHHGRGRASGVALDWSLAYAFTVRGGRVARVEFFRARADALKAVGLAE